MPTMMSACMLARSADACGRGLMAAAAPSGPSWQAVRRPSTVCAAGGGPESSKRRASGSKGGKGSGGAPRSRPRPSRQAGRQQAPQQQQPSTARKVAPEPEQLPLAPPIRMRAHGELSTSDRMPPPLWSTFCGVTNGLWCGITAAYSPFTGEPEPLALDEAGKPLRLLHQCCVEERVVDEQGVDSLVRHVARAASQDGLQREMAQGGRLQFPACPTGGASTSPASGGLAECWDEERFHSEQEGLVVFDGGSYSLGPSTIGSPAELPQQAAVAFDDDAAAAAAAALEAALAARSATDSLELAAELADEEGAASSSGGVQDEGGEDEAPDLDAVMAQEQAELDWTAAVIDHCMQWGGEQRLRIRITLDTAGGSDGTDLEIQPLRVAVAREAWEGLPGSYTPSAQGPGAAQLQEASRRVRLDSEGLTGEWKVFEVTAVTVDDVSLVTGLPAPATLYTAAESLRSFDARLPEDGGDGALLRLPHSCGVQLETLRVDNSRRRGLRVSTHWSPQPGMLLTMARLYDPDGRLLETSCSTAIRA